LESVLMAWSGGKDSAMALASILAGSEYRVAALLTTVTTTYDRISMHGVRRSLLRKQAEALGMELEEVEISANSSNDEYEAGMAKALAKHGDLGVTSVVFGDIFLEDLRRYREDKLGGVGMRCIFPLWKLDTAHLARSFIATGFKAVTTCVDTQAIGKEFVGRQIDEIFLSELPQSADPCGENGEFHSFVYDGPIFKSRIRFTLGEKLLRDERFYYCDLVDV
jgi:uncharacterized protein (TIGR00290 family)